MRDGFKIVDTDSHMMEPDDLWERHMEDAYKSLAPKMGQAPGSGRRTFIVEGESFTREKGKYPMAAPAFLKAAQRAMDRFDRARKTGFSAQSRAFQVPNLRNAPGGQALGSRGGARD